VKGVEIADSRRETSRQRSIGLNRAGLCAAAVARLSCYSKVAVVENDNPVRQQNQPVNGCHPVPKYISILDKPPGYLTIM
jgi:hypothetical protein